MLNGKDNIIIVSSRISVINRFRILDFLYFECFYLFSLCVVHVYIVLWHLSNTKIIYNSYYV